MTETIQLGDIAIAVRRKEIKHVHLSVHPPGGRVTLVAPKGTRSEVARVKPHPDHLLCALERLSVEPTRAVMVGDHWMDVQAGRAAGMATVGILSAGRPADFFSREPPDLLIRELRELVAWISR